MRPSASQQPVLIKSCPGHSETTVDTRQCDTVEDSGEYTVRALNDLSAQPPSRIHPHSSPNILHHQELFFKTVPSCQLVVSFCIPGGESVRGQDGFFVAMEMFAQFPLGCLDRPGEVLFGRMKTVV